MTYRGRFKDRGFIVLDAILGLAIAAIFVSVMAYASLEGEAVYERAAMQESLIRSYRAHAGELSGLMPGQSLEISDSGASAPPVSVSAAARWYGNDRIETDIEASSSGKSVSFEQVRAYPFDPMSDSQGAPLCSVDHSGAMPIVPIALPLDPSWAITDFQVRDGIAYIAMDPSKRTDPDFATVDISDPKHPVSLAAIDTGPGLNALAIAGRYAYAAAASTVAQLHVIRMDGPASLSLVSRYALPLPQASTSPPRATAISYEKGRIFLGTEKWDGDELSLIDVSDPASPSKVAGFETGSKVNAIYARGDALYAAASDEQQLRRFGISGDGFRLEAPFSPSGWQRQEGEAVASFEGDVAFGRTSGGYDISADKELFLWPDGATDPFVADMPGGAYGMVIDRSHVFAITRTIGRELTIFDRTLSTSTVRYIPLPYEPQKIACDLGNIYILAKGAPELYEITFD